MKYQGRFLLCLFAILVSFSIPLWLVIRIYESAQSKLSWSDFKNPRPSIYVERFIADDTLEVRSVSYRKVSERRGSWPLAYKNVTASEDI